MSESRRIRSFRCADNLWRSLEDESDERGITIDALITEALWSYLRTAPEFSTEATHQAQVEAMMLSSARIAQRRQDPLHEGLAAAPRVDPQASTVIRPRSMRDNSADESEQTVTNLELAFDEQGRLLDPVTGALVQPEDTDDDTANLSPTSEEARPSLTVVFSGTRYDVRGERFLIGRASTGTDLQIRDANVSRKHAAIIFHDGGWFIHDLQSTNGVEFRGRRIHTRRIENHDRYTICDYELVLELED